MKVYEGIRSGNECIVTVDGKPLDPRFDLKRYSPSGFEWGYMGEGPKQLAIALIADHTSDNAAAVDFHRMFTFKIITRLNLKGWALNSEQIEEALKNL